MINQPDDHLNKEDDHDDDDDDDDGDDENLVGICVGFQPCLILFSNLCKV